MVEIGVVLLSNTPIGNARPAPDSLPHPMSSLITGITPQQALEQGMPVVGYPRPGVLLRNAVFMLILLGHGFRRLVPPY